MFIMPYAFGLLAAVLIGTVLVGGYIEERRVLGCAKSEEKAKSKPGCCAH